MLAVIAAIKYVLQLVHLKIPQDFRYTTDRKAMLP